ncbi:MAG TPA: hypothetical protein VGB98_01825 [Pyrinomonadaceae bacterium]
MSEEQTGRLNDGGSFESRVLEQLAALREGMNSLGGRLSGLEERFSGVETRLSGVEVRLLAVEEKVDARLRETRPIWEAVLSRLEKIGAKMDIFSRDLIDTRTDVEMLKRRLPAA